MEICIKKWIKNNVTYLIYNLLIRIVVQSTTKDLKRNYKNKDMIFINYHVRKHGGDKNPKYILIV